MKLEDVVWHRPASNDFWRVSFAPGVTIFLSQSDDAIDFDGRADTNVFVRKGNYSLHEVSGRRWINLDPIMAQAILYELSKDRPDAA